MRCLTAYISARRARSALRFFLLYSPMVDLENFRKKSRKFRVRDFRVFWVAAPKAPPAQKTSSFSWEARSASPLKPAQSTRNVEPGFRVFWVAAPKAPPTQKTRPPKQTLASVGRRAAPPH